MLSNIRLQHFRSYTDTSFEFEDGVNIIIGPNASGKTNLLEAVLFVARGKSFRVKDQELLQHGSEWARLDADTPDTLRTVKLQQTAEKLQKTISIGDKTLSRLSPQTIIPTVLFEPSHLQFLVGAPEMRRDFIDSILEQIDGSYTRLVNNYKRTLTQRNSLLKSERQPTQDQLFVWNVRLSEFGAQIVIKRHALIDEINQQASDTYSAIAGKQSDLTIKYTPDIQSDQYASYLHKKLEERYELDRLRGFTSVGPHREDITLFLDGNPQQHTASRGEVRTTLLTLKIIELHMLEAAIKQRPLLLLDDVFSELDGARRKALTKYLRRYQTFITTTDADMVMNNIKNFNPLTL
jgi:DNA replication and repair protein RecF